MSKNLFFKIKRIWRDYCHRSILCKSIPHEIVDGNIKDLNFGDDLNYTFLPLLFKRSVSLCEHSLFAVRFKRINYLFIGSIIDLLGDNRSIIWGAGCLTHDRPIKKPLKVLAVRGPLTRQRLLDNGVDCPPIYGDPAMLLKFYYKPEERKRFKYGIIPHKQDNSSFFINKLLSILPNSVLIDLENYHDVKHFISQVTCCEYIISSSLHGLIIAETYRIPNLWISSTPLHGGFFKFHDFFLSIQKDRKGPIVDSQIDSETDVIDFIKEWELGEIDLTPLIKVSPFDIFLP